PVGSANRRETPEALRSRPAHTRIRRVPGCRPTDRWGYDGSFAGVQAENGNSRDAEIGHPAQVMRQANARIGQLPLAGSPLQLVIDLIGHAQARGCNRMAEAFEPAVDLAGQAAIPVEKAIEDVMHRATV